MTTSLNAGYKIALRNQIKGDVFDDPLVLGMYATDASVYQITPVAVVCPRDEQDVIACMAIANTFGVPILARGGGTSLAGQTVGSAVVIDFSRYMNHVLEVDFDQQWAQTFHGAGNGNAAQVFVDMRK